MAEDAPARAAEALAGAEALLIGAGAGIGVDSGLPDFRGDEGFWRAYPPMARLGIRFVEMANPRWFEHDPSLAWGFYGHRLNLYRETRPHAGFSVLLELARRAPRGAFVFTSNVDGQFQRAGFPQDRIVECHGSIHHLQCTIPCSDAIWPADDVTVHVDPETFRASDPLPACPRCGRLARPNVLMFGDYAWVPRRTAAQERRFRAFLDGLGGASLAVIEIGAGTAVPTVRWTCERIAADHGAPLVRVNPREAWGPPGTISIPLGAREALETIARRLEYVPGTSASPGPGPDRS